MDFKVKFEIKAKAKQVMTLFVVLVVLFTDKQEVLSSVVTIMNV